MTLFLNALRRSAAIGVPEYLLRQEVYTGIFWKIFSGYRVAYIRTTVPCATANPWLFLACHPRVEARNLAGGGRTTVA